MGRGNYFRASRNFSPRAAAALFAWSADQSRPACAFALAGHRVSARRLVLQPGLARRFHGRLRYFAPDNLEPAAVDHVDLLVQSSGRVVLALRDVQRTTRIARSPYRHPDVFRWNCRSGDDLRSALAST